MPRSCLALISFLLCSPLAGQDLYVDGSRGNDAGSGTSLLEAVRTIQRAADLAVAGDTIQVRAGTYRETVRPPRSGSAAQPIVFQPYGSEVVIISGSEPITGWVAEDGAIYRAPMAGDFFSRATPGDGVNLFDAAVGNQADQVFCDGRMLLVARWPNTPSLSPSHPVKAICDEFVSKSRAGNWTTGVMVDLDNALTAAQCIGAEIFFQPSETAWSWCFTGRVTAKAGGRFTFQTRSDAGKDFSPEIYEPRSRYLLFNHRDLLDSPGEWFHDKANGSLSLWAPDGRSPEGRIEAKRRAFAFDLSGRSHITIRGITCFACSITTDVASGGDNVPYDATGAIRYPWRNAAWGRPAVPFHNPPYNDAPATGITLIGLDVQYPTHYTDVSGHFLLQWGQSSGIVLSGTGHVIRDSIIRWSAGNGVSLLGRGHKVLNNRIEDVNYQATSCAFVGCGGTDRGSSDHEIAYNTCVRAGKHGLMYYCYNSDPEDPATRARVHHNDISDYTIQDGDSGGIYTGGDLRFARIDHNHFHNAHHNIDDYPGRGNYTVGGIYPDYARNLIIDHNLIWNVEWGIHLQNQFGDQANFLVYHNTMMVSGLSDPKPVYGPFAVVNNSTANQLGTVILNNLAFCSDGSPGYRFTDIGHDSVVPRLVRSNLLWDHIAGSSTDPRFAAGVAPAGLRLTTASSAAIDRGETLPATFQRGGFAVPTFREAPIGAPDLGALEHGTDMPAVGATIPGVVADPRALVSTATSVQLAWEPATRATTYHIEYTSDGLLWNVFRNETGTGGTVTGLVPSTRYRFRVRAINGIGTAGASAEVVATTAAGTGTCTLAFTVVAASIDEHAGAITLTVNRSGDTSGLVGVSYASADGTALAGSDYTATNGTLTFAAGASRATLSVPIIDDTMAEGSETFVVSLTAPSGNGAALGEIATVTITVIDDDNSSGTLRFASGTTSVSEAAGAATIAVERVGGSMGAVSVRYGTADGTAAAGSDYTAASGILNWAAGDSTAKAFSVTIIADGLPEGAETIALTLADPTGGASAGGSATLTIVEPGATPTIVEPGATPTSAVSISGRGGCGLGSGFAVIGLLSLMLAARRRRG